MEKFGIENLKKVIGFGCDLAKQVAESLGDGWQWTDALSFIDEMAALPGTVKALPSVKAELADLSTDERAELHAFIVDRFDIPNDRVEAFIEDAVALALSVVELVEKFKTLKQS